MSLKGEDLTQSVIMSLQTRRCKFLTAKSEFQLNG